MRGEGEGEVCRVIPMVGGYVERWGTRYCRGVSELPVTVLLKNVRKGRVAGKIKRTVTWGALEYQRYAMGLLGGHGGIPKLKPPIW